MSQTDHCCGPGYASPSEAKKAAPEKLLYVPCIVPEKEDYLATIDVDPTSATYSTVIHRVFVPTRGDELHHTGWNACSSCHSDTTLTRRFLLAPALSTGNIFVFDVQNSKAPVLHKVVSGAEIKEKLGLTYPHTSHCLATGEIMISFMGDKDGNAKGGFVLLDGKTFDIKGTWSDTKTPFGYDFWYQPRHNVMVSTQWGAPNAFKGGFNPAHVGEKLYGDSIHFWDFKARTLIKTIELGPKGLIPLEARFLHDPSKAVGFVGAALSSNIILFYKNNDTWETKPVIEVPAKAVTGWALPNMPSLITDILVSIDDKFLFLSNWLHGDIRQYDVTDPHHPKLVGQVFVGGSIRADGAVTINDPNEHRPVIPTVKGVALRGGPQMIQLSLDGKRLYVTNSLFSPWDKQFYPNLYQQGSQLLQIDVNNETGGLKVNPNFLVDFSSEPHGPALAHEVRYPGGDCTSDIWV